MNIAPGYFYIENITPVKQTTIKEFINDFKDIGYKIKVNGEDLNKHNVDGDVEKGILSRMFYSESILDIQRDRDGSVYHIQ